MRKRGTFKKFLTFWILQFLAEKFQMLPAIYILYLKSLQALPQIWKACFRTILGFVIFI